MSSDSIQRTPLPLNLTAIAPDGPEEFSGEAAAHALINEERSSDRAFKEPQLPAWPGPPS